MIMQFVQRTQRWDEFRTLLTLVYTKMLGHFNA